MASNRCSICEKAEGKCICGGCKRLFCVRHFMEHRQELSMQFDQNVVSAHDALLDQINKLKQTNSVSSDLFSQISQWEISTVEKVHIAAEETRHQIIILLDREKEIIKEQFGILTQEVRNRRHEDNFAEDDVERLTQTMNQLKLSLKELTESSKVNVVVVENDQIDWSRLIYAEEQKEDEKLPNRLVVDDTDQEDSSVVTLSQQKMDELQIFRGDAVAVKGRKRETICIVLADDTCPDDRIKMSDVLQNNLQVRAGDLVLIQCCQDVPYGKSVRIVPTNDTPSGVTGNMCEDYVRLYFREAYRPLHIGDTFIVRCSRGSLEFKVIETEPSPYCIVAPDTTIFLGDKPLKKK